MELKYGVISADDHVCEHAEVWTKRMPKQKWGDRVPHVETQADGSQRWVVDGRLFEPSNAGFSEAALAAQSPNQRLRAMDRDGIDYSVLYPSAGGMSGEWFGRLDDIELEIACAQGYNDWLIEEWVSQSPRFVAQCIVPLWPRPPSARMH